MVLRQRSAAAKQRLIDWGLTALSAQIGYILPVKQLASLN